MPTYDYKCLDCCHTFELFQPMSAKPIEICPECGGKIKRLIGAGSGPIFKGSGFYHTDYKNNTTKTDKSNSSTKTSQAADSKKTDSPKLTAKDKKE